jgi:hypothetical protein
MSAAAPAFGPLQFLYRVDGVLTEILPYGLSPEGLRVDSWLEGQCAGEGPFAGATVRGISYLTFRLDGVANLEFRSDIRSPAGEHIAGHVIGYAIPPGDFELPSPDEVMAPGYSWPDVAFRIHAFITYRTGFSLAWLNRTVVAAEGMVNPGTRRFSHSMGVLQPPD